MADVLSQSEVQSLLAALAPVQKAKSTRSASVEQSPFDDFSGQDRIRAEQMHALGALHEEFSREFATALSEMLRLHVEIAMNGIEQRTCDEWLARCDNPTCFAVMHSKALGGPLSLELSPSAVFSIIERMLGGAATQTPVVPSRALTDIELTLVSRILSVAVRGLEHAWRDLCDLQLTIAHVDSDPHRATFVPPDEIVFMVRLEMTLGETRGPIRLCIPLSSIEPIARKLSPGRESSQQSTVKMVVQLGETKLSAREIMNLAVGDIIMTERDTSQGLDVLIEGRMLFEGLAGVLDGQKAVRIRQSVAQPNSLITEQRAGLV